MRWFPAFCLTLSAATAAEVQFSKTVYPALEKAACRSCHNHDGVASATRLQFPEADATPERIDAFGTSLVTLVNRAHPERSLLLQKPTNRTSHVGGERIKPGSPEAGLLKAWITRLAGMSGASWPKRADTRRLAPPRIQPDPCFGD